MMAGELMVSFWGDENVLSLAKVTVAHSCKDPKTTESYTFDR